MGGRPKASVRLGEAEFVSETGGPDCWGGWSYFLRNSRAAIGASGVGGSRPGHTVQQSFWFSCITLLVREGRAFYNPSNTAMEAVVLLSRHLGIQPPRKKVDFPRANASILISILEFPRSTE